MKKYITGLYYTMILTWIGLFGGSFKDKKNVYILWPIHIITKRQVTIERCNFYTLYEIRYLFHYHT
jgi:hypothetical protein